MSKMCMHGKVVAQPGTRCELAAILLDAARLVSNASGCRLFFVSISPTEPDALWVTEVWDSEEAHKASFAIPGVAKLFSIGRSLIVGTEGKMTMIPIGGKGVD
jgi:quinol monooxygenase YgiN